MMRRRNLVLAIVFASVLLVALFIYLRPPNSAPPQTRTFNFVIRNLVLYSGPSTPTVNEGDQVVFNITCDIIEEFHLHGYDLKVQLQPNVPTQLTFAATLTGSFEFELENHSMMLGTLEVLPR